MKSNIYIIGCGGVGSWLAPSLALLTQSPKNIILVDADKLEKKNLNRQLFTEADIGKSKAEALAAKYGTQFSNEWFFEGTLENTDNDWIICCVDNHSARREALNEADRVGCQVIIAANETHSAEAYYYKRPWAGTPIDPRVYFPDILTDTANDPRRAVIGCTGEVQKENPQLVTSNAMAAALAGHLFALWHLEAHKLKAKTQLKLPYRLVANASKLETFKVEDINKTTERTEHERRTEPAPTGGAIADGGHSLLERNAETAGPAASSEH